METAPQKQLPIWLMMVSLMIVQWSRYRRSAFAVQFTNCTAERAGSACELALLGERAEAKPGLHRGCELAVAREDHSLICNRGTHGIESHPDRRHGPEVRRDVEIDFKPGIDLAQI